MPLAARGLGSDLRLSIGTGIGALVITDLRHNRRAADALDSGADRTRLRVTGVTSGTPHGRAGFGGSRADRITRHTAPALLRHCADSGPSTVPGD
jgi:hypothetical protein